MPKAKQLLQKHQQKLISQRQKKQEVDKDLNEWLSGFEKKKDATRGQRGGIQLVQASDSERRHRMVTGGLPRDDRRGGGDRGRDQGRSQDRRHYADERPHRQNHFNPRDKNQNAHSNGDRHQIHHGAERFHSDEKHNGHDERRDAPKNDSQKPLVKFISKHRQPSRYAKMRNQNPFSKISNRTFGEALLSIDLKRKRDDDYDEEEFTTFGLPEPEKMAIKRQKLEDDTNNEQDDIPDHRRTEEPNPEDGDDKIDSQELIEPKYENNFVASLFASSGNLTAPFPVAHTDIASKHWTFPSKVKSYKRIVIDGDALVATFSRKYPNTSYPIVELAIAIAFQNWMKKNSRRSDHIVFKSTVMASNKAIISVFPTDLSEDRDAVVGASRLEMEGNFSVPFYKASDFLVNELTLSTVSGIVKMLERDEFAKAGLTGIEEQQLVRFINYMRRTNRIDAKMASIGPTECMLEFENAIVFYDAANVVKSCHFNADAVPMALRTWCTLNLIRMFGKKYGVKKSVMVLDHDPMRSKFKNPYPKYDDTLEILVGHDHGEQKADTLIISESKKYVDAGESVILVTNDTELCWRGSMLTECRVDVWKQATLSLFRSKIDDHQNVLDKTCHDVMLWYLDETLECGAWDFYPMPEEEDRAYMRKSITRIMEKSGTESNGGKKSKK